MWGNFWRDKDEYSMASGSKKSSDLLFMSFRDKGQDFGDCPLLFLELERNTALKPVTRSWCVKDKFSSWKLKFVWSGAFQSMNYLSNKKRGYLPLFWLFLLILQRSQFSFLGIVKGVSSLLRHPFLHLWHNPHFYWSGVGEHYVSFPKTEPF